MRLFLELCVVGVWLIVNSVNAKSIDHPRVYSLELPFSKYGEPPKPVLPNLSKPQPPIPPLLHGPPKTSTSKPLTTNSESHIDPTSSNIISSDKIDSKTDFSESPTTLPENSKTPSQELLEKSTKHPELPLLLEPMKPNVVLSTLPPELPSLPLKPELPLQMSPNVKPSVDQPEILVALKLPSLPENLKYPTQELLSIQKETNIGEKTDDTTQILEKPGLTAAPYPSELPHSSHGKSPVTLNGLLTKLPTVLPNLTEMPETNLPGLPITDVIEGLQFQGQPESNNPQFVGVTKTPVEFLTTSHLTIPNLTEKEIFAPYPSELPHSTYGGPPIISSHKLSGLSEEQSQTTLPEEPIRPVILLPKLPLKLLEIPEKLSLPPQKPIRGQNNNKVQEVTKIADKPLPSQTLEEITRPVMLLPTLPLELPLNPVSDKAESHKPTLLLTLHPIPPSLPEKPKLPSHEITVNTEKSSKLPIGTELPHSTNGELNPSILLTPPKIAEKPTMVAYAPKLSHSTLGEAPITESPQPALLLTLPPTLSSQNEKAKLPSHEVTVSLEKPSQLPIRTGLPHITYGVPSQFAVKPTITPSQELTTNPEKLVTVTLPDTLELPSESPHVEFIVTEEVLAINKPEASVTQLTKPQITTETTRPQSDIIFKDLTPKRARSTGVLSLDPRKREVREIRSSFINFHEPITSYGTLINHGLEDVKPQYIPLTYVAQGLPNDHIQNFKEHPVKLPPGVLTKEMIGPYPMEIASNFYGVTVMNPMMMFSQITEPSS